MDQHELKRLFDEQQKAFTAFKDIHAKMTEEIKSVGHATSETKAMLDKIQDRLDEIETKLNRPVYTQTEAKEKRQELVLKAYDMFLRKGAEHIEPEAREAWAQERKFWSTDDDTAAGYLVPQAVSDRLIEMLVEFSPMRELATVESISVGNSLVIPSEGPEGFEAGWVGERQARIETATGTIGAEQIPTHEIYAKPKVTQTQLDDAAYDVEGRITRKVGERFGKIEGAAFIVGSGVGKPEGILTRPGLTTIKSRHATELTDDGLIDLVYDLPEAYARNATMLLRRLTVREIRKLKDGTGAFMWQPGIASGQPATILGYPYREAPDMDAMGAGNKVIAFGDWRAAYTIVDRQGVRVLRDPYSSKPFIEFYTTKRVGGQVVLLEAYRVQEVGL